MKPAGATAAARKRADLWGRLCKPHLETELKTSESILCMFAPPTSVLREPIAPRFAGVSGSVDSASSAICSSVPWLNARCGAVMPT